MKLCTPSPRSAGFSLQFDERQRHRHVSVSATSCAAAHKKPDSARDSISGRHHKVRAQTDDRNELWGEHRTDVRTGTCKLPIPELRCYHGFQDFAGHPSPVCRHCSWPKLSSWADDLGQHKILTAINRRGGQQNLGHRRRYGGRGGGMAAAAGNAGRGPTLRGECLVLLLPTLSCCLLSLLLPTQYYPPHCLTCRWLPRVEVGCTAAQEITS